MSNPDLLELKVAAVYNQLQASSRLLVAFSGGVDSSVLLKLAADCPRIESLLAVTFHSEVSTAEDLASARAVAARCGADHLIVDWSELSSPEFTANSPRRCYHCKRRRFVHLQTLARQYGLAVVVEGSNLSDLGDYRPGLEALRELGVSSPLLAAGLSKPEIRCLAARLGLPNWNQPAQACLASRVPFGIPITAAVLQQIAAAEEALRARGFQGSRVRHHGELARIEVAAGELPQLLTEDNRQAIISACRNLGYRYITVDLEGFRSGSLNPLSSQVQS